LPDIDPLPEGLPPVVTADDGSAVFPAETHREVRLFLARCLHYPTMARRLAEVEAKRCDEEWLNTLAVAQDELAYRLRAEQELGALNQWQTWEVVLAAVGSAAAGGIVGFIVAAVAD